MRFFLLLLLLLLKIENTIQFSKNINMKKIILYLIVFFTVGITFSQNLSLVPNQPDLDYFTFDKAEDNYYFLSYVALGYYSFDGNDIQQVPFVNNDINSYYRGEYNGAYFFVQNEAPLSIFKFD